MPLTSTGITVKKNSSIGSNYFKPPINDKKISL